MASKKDKLLENAQRFVLKGQIDKAIKEYQQVVALDPREIRFRQRLAELLVRDNRKEEAIAEYEDIGKHYAENSYFLKAIAVYKQIQRLDSANPAVCHTLAKLNQRQGLAGNALAEFNQTVRLLEQQGDLPKAVEVVQEMISLDGDNSATLLKHAELLYACGQTDPSYAAFSALFTRLVHGGDDAAAEKVSLRMAELFPGKDEHELELLALRMQQGDLDGALSAVRQILRQHEANLRGWRLLCDVLRRKGEKGEVHSALERMAALFPDDLSVLRDMVRSHLERGMFADAAQLLAERADRFIEAGRVSELEELFLALPPALRAEPQVQDGLRRVYEASGDWEKLNSLRAPVLQSAAPAAPAAAAPPPVEPGPAWEEDIDLDFDDHLAESEEEPAAAAPAAVNPGALELEWPDEPSSFLAQEPAAAPVAEEPADLPWGEMETVAEPQEEEQEEPATDGAPDFFGGDGDAPELELSLEDNLAEPESVPLDLEMAEEDLDLFAEQGEGAQELSDAEPPPSLPVEEPGPSLDWQDVFPGCVKAEEEVDREDAESHYDLGIAYLEMGRFDAAFQEFAKAAANPRRRLDCLILQAMSHRSKNDDAAAEDLLNRGLLVGELTSQERLTLRYELASLYEGRDGIESALPLYREISAVDPSFRDVAKKLSQGEEPLDIIDLDLEEVS